MLDSDKVAGEIGEIVSRINAQFPGAVYYEQRTNISTEARITLWQLAHVVVYSAIRNRLPRTIRVTGHP